MEHSYDVDLAVIGSGPGGQKAAIMAAKLGKGVCVIDSKSMVGACASTPGRSRRRRCARPCST